MVSGGFKLILAADSRMTGKTDPATVKFRKSQLGAVPPGSALELTLSAAPAVPYHPAPRCPTVAERTYPLDRNGPDIGRNRIHGGSSSIPQRLAGACPQRPVPQSREQFQSRRVRRHSLWRRRGDGELGDRRVVFTSRQAGRRRSPPLWDGTQRRSLRGRGIASCDNPLGNWGETDRYKEPLAKA